MQNLANLDLTAMFDSLKHPGVVAAMAEIKASNLNRMRCILTGAPYATIDDSELELTLTAYAGSDFAMTCDQLMDKWDLNLLAMCSKVGPALMNRKEITLSEIARTDSVGGYARLLTFYLTRFFYSFDHFKLGMTTTRSIERLHFAIDWHDFLVTLDLETLRRAAFRLASDDGWLQLGFWKDLGLFHIRARTNGIVSEEFTTLRQATLRPDAMPVTLESFHGLMDDLTTLMIRSEVLGLGPHHIAPPNRESHMVASLVADLLGIENRAVEITSPQIEIDPIAESEAMAWAEYKERITGRTIRVSVSATHGPGFKPGDRGVYRKKAEPKAPKTPKEPKEKAIKVRVAKPKTEKARKLNDLIAKINFTL